MTDPEPGQENRKIQSHKDLKVWSAAMELALAVYRATGSFPKTETFGLTSQMRRAAASVPANIAEGFARQHKPEFLQFLYIAKGSLSELGTYIELSQSLDYLDDRSSALLASSTETVGKMLYGLICSLKMKMTPGAKETARAPLSTDD
jgi:four helix bundle protein